MSRSKRKVKHQVPGDGCWLCDHEARKEKFKGKKEQPDPETRSEITGVSFSGRTVSSNLTD